MSFCAICTADIIGHPYFDNLGKNGAIVAVCSSCHDDKPRAYDSERGYEIREGVSTGAIRKAADKVLREYGAPASAPTSGVVGRNANHRTPGWLLVRIPHSSQNRERDFREALLSMRHEPWFRELRMIGSTKRYYLFERPDPKVAAAQRQPSTNPLVDIERYRA